MWHDTYLKAVLQPDYTYASEHLLPHLFDALTAHSLMLDGVGVTHAAEAARLLRDIRREPFPPYDPRVEDVFFTIDQKLAGLNPDAAGAMRTALSRNDLDMTIYRLSARLRLMRALSRLLTLRHGTEDFFLSNSAEIREITCWGAMSPSSVGVNPSG